MPVSLNPVTFTVGNELQNTLINGVFTDDCEKLDTIILGSGTRMYKACLIV